MKDTASLSRVQYEEWKSGIHVVLSKQREQVKLPAPYKEPRDKQIDSVPRSLIDVTSLSK